MPFISPKSSLKKSYTKNSRRSQEKAMPIKRWKDITDKIAPERLARLKREAREEYDSIGYAALRKARELTQVEMAEKLGVSQSSVAGIESRTELQISTLAKYIRAMGGELQMLAVFPDATFNLEPHPAAEKS
jgi:DNA-binding XRE family transcriptional regulator